MNRCRKFLYFSIYILIYSILTTAARYTKINLDIVLSYLNI